MNRARHDFISDLDEVTKDNLKLTGRPDARLKSIPIDPGILRYNGDNYLVATDVTREKPKRRRVLEEHEHIIRLHVLSDVEGYVQAFNVVIPCDSDVEHQKYLDLKYQIRNTERVKVTFKNLRVSASIVGHALYFKADDYKVFDPNSPRYIEI